MTSIATIRTDVTNETQDGLGAAKLDESGRIVFRSVFNITIGLFARAHGRKGLDVWKSAKFRRFILVQAKMIGREAAKHAAGGIVNGPIYNRAALKVMRATNKGCHLTVKNGVIIDIPKPGNLLTLKRVRLDGDVCSLYLQAQDFS